MSNAQPKPIELNTKQNQVDMGPKGINGACCHSDVTDYVNASLEVLRKAGFRVTGPRKLVLECLAEVNRPLSPRGMLEYIAADSSTPNIDPVSIYRILEALHELGIVHKVGPSGEYIACLHIDCKSQPHILLRCTGCNAINEIDVPRPVVEPMHWFLKEKHSFLPEAHMFQIDGLCNSCTGSSK